MCFRLSWPVIPRDESNGSLLNSTEAQAQGYTHLASWLQKAERLWTKHGSGKRTLKEQLDYYGQLTAQFPPVPLRVVYSKTGTLPAASLLSDMRGIDDHKLYWAKVDSKQE